MVRQPKPGLLVRVRYAKARCHLFPQHGRDGVVIASGRGPGPRNVLVRVDGWLVVVPAGNLVDRSLMADPPAPAVKRSVQLPLFE